MALQVWLPLDGNLRNLGLTGPVVQTATPVWDNDGKIGKAIKTGNFYIPAADVKTFYNNNAMSFCFWIKPIVAAGTTDTILLGQNTMSSPTGDTRMYSIFIYNNVNKLHLSWQNNLISDTTVFYGYSSPEIFPSNVWTHCAVVYSGTQVRIYINGTLYSTNNCTKSSRTNFEFNVPFTGSNNRLINDLRIYDHALSSKEVKEISKGLVLHYPLDNNEDAGEGNIVYDCSGYGHHGMWYGNKSTSTDTARYSKCTYLDNGQTTYIQSNGGCGNPSDAITMNIWFKSSNKTPGSDYHHMFNGLTSWVYIEMAVHKDGYLRCGLYINGTRYVANCGSGILDGKWHMLTMTYDGANIKRYVDGVLLNTQAATGAIDRPNDPFIFGHGASTGYYCKEAYLSDARIYATALSAADILELYKTAAVIDNQQNLYAYEFVEDDDAQVYSTGVIKTNSLTETTKTQIYNDGQIKANALYEI